MVWVLPTPGAYPRKSLNLPPFFVGEHSSSHWSGVLGIAIIVVETCDFVDAVKGRSGFKVSEVRGQIAEVKGHPNRSLRGGTSAKL
jgi:hypothetical protein